MQTARTTLFLLIITAGLGLLAAGCRGLGAPAVPPATPTTAPPPAVITTTETPAPLPPTATPTPQPTATLVSSFPSLGDPLVPEVGNTGYDVLTYTLDLAIDPLAQMVEGTTTIAAVNTITDLARVSFDFVGFEVQEVVVDGVPVPPVRENNKLLVDLPAPLGAAGTPFTVDVHYAGQPVQQQSPYIRSVDYLGLTFLGNSTFYVLAEPDGARYWFPVNDHPTDKAAYHISLTVPRGLAAIANGRLVGSALGNMPDGSPGATFHWQHNHPMASYLALAAAGHYLRYDEIAPNGVPLVYYYFPEFEEDFREATDVTGEAMAWMSELYGPYPFDSYGQATYYAMGVSMESQTMTLLSYQMLNERTVIHELAHAWFGNWVSPETWSDVWRNEGFATYTELLWLEYKEPGALEREITNIRQQVAERGQSYPLDEPPPERLLAFDAYNRGALLVHELRLLLGDEAFFNGLRLFFERYGGSTANHDEFQAVLEEAAGFPLDDFFAPWLE